MTAYFSKKSNKISSLLLMILSLSFFVSCSKSKDKPQEKEIIQTISFWNFWSEPNQVKELDKLIKSFEKENNCTVKTTNLSWNDGKTKLLAAFNSKTAPDILELGSDWVAQFSSAGVLADVSESIQHDKYIDWALAPSIWKKKYYAFPWIADTRVLFYNKELMKQAGLDSLPPATLAQLFAYSEAVNHIDGVYGFGVNGSDAHRLYKKIVSFMWTFGGELFDNNKVVVNSDANIKALDYYASLSSAGIIETQRQLDAMFAQGKLGFWISGGWLLNKIKSTNPDLAFGVAVMPNVGENKGISFAGGEYLAISDQSENKELAIKFAKFITDGKTIIEFCKQVPEAGFPADKNYFNDPYYASQQYRSVFAQQLASAKMTPVHPKWLKIESLLENATEKVIYAKSSSKEALDDLQNKVEKILKK